MNKILIPVDFSETSKNALIYALDFFSYSPLKVTLLHVYGVDAPVTMMKSIDDIMEDDAKKEMNQLLKIVEEKYPEVKFNTELINNSPVSTISSIADKAQYDFIVMGTKGVSGLEEVFVGSVAGGVISKTKTPAIIVPKDYTFTPMKKVVLAIGENTFNDDNADVLINLLDSFDSEVEVLNIGGSGDEKTTLEDVSSIKSLNPKIVFKEKSKNISLELTDYITETNPHLVTLVKGNKSFLGKIFGESVTLKQTFHSKVPLLILH